jgi:hypothetical protein
MNATYTVLRKIGSRELIHRSAGSAAAGSGTTPVREAWGSISTARDGTTHGRWFRTREEAEADINNHLASTSQQPDSK